MIQESTSSSVMVVGDVDARIGTHQCTPVSKDHAGKFEMLIRAAKDLKVDTNGKNVIEMCEDNSFTVLNGRTQSDGDGRYTFMRGQAVSTIDYCLINGMWHNRIEDMQVVPETFSDHAQPNPHDNKLLPKLQWNDRYRQQYRAQLKQKSERQDCQPEAPNIETLTNWIKIAAACMQKPAHYTRKQPWFDSECHRERQRSMITLKRSLHSGNADEKRKYQEANTAFKTMCRKKRTTNLGIELEVNNIKDSKGFWEFVRRTAKRYCTILLCQGKEVKAAVSKSKNCKAPGIERIPAEFLKNAPDVADAANYRRISFLTSTMKVFASIVLSRLNDWVEKNGVLSEYQAGFRRGYSTVDSIFVLVAIAKEYKRRNQKMYTCFIDFKAAFDTIDRHSLFLKLSLAGVSTKILNILKCLYSDNTAAVWNGNSLFEYGYK
ncbi:uncharacterized protein LOC121404807 [Drosophila obscura]|uniref:uncharacterized protein LOC121404807 n=1 Tax=Drosophila obscura TaxID=7282 RepID=UPI001BB22D01|nr:uncharacterized protein LOC121404807 [Drosophila obscura]